MPSEASHGFLGADFAIPELSPVDPTVHCYPFAPLQLSGRRDRREFPTVVLENSYLSVTLAPNLGGRIVALHDKRVGRDILKPPTELSLKPGGRRGLQSPFGIQLVTDAEERLNSTGPVDLSVHEAGDEDSPAAVWIAESAFWPLSFHLKIELPPDRAEVHLEARILNRSLTPAHYNAGLQFPIGAGLASAYGSEVLWWDEEADTGLVIGSEELTSHSVRHDSVLLTRFAKLRAMAPRQVDSWQATLMPVSDHVARPHVFGGIAVSFSDERIQIQASQEFAQHKILLLTRSGETMEAMANLTADKPISLSLGQRERNPQSLAILSPHREEIFRASPGHSLTPIPEHVAHEPEPLHEVPHLEMSKGELQNASFQMQHRSLSHLLLGIRALQEREYATADFQFEQALLFNGEDPLTWWFKAIARRHEGDESDDRPELPNAHYLAPLEPGLRAEGLLGQSPPPGFDPNPLLQPLTELPENLVEVACHLVQAGLFADASRWIDESIRHEDMPMLRYLLAHSLLAGSRMTVEAAQHIAAAAKLEFGPPYPHRPIEREALTYLSLRFPDDAQLARYVDLLRG